MHRNNTPSTADESQPLENKVVIITGGAGLLGTEWKKALERVGAHVVVFDTRTSRSAEVLSVDVTNEKAAKHAVARVVKKYGAVDVLINAAGLNPVPGSRASAQQFTPYERYPLALWRDELEVGLTGSLIAVQAVAPHMIERRNGSIINISSIYGVTGPDNRLYGEKMFKSIGYATVKGALLNFTRAWASYLGPYNVRVNCLVLGGVFNSQDAEFVKRYSAKTMLGSMAAKDDFNGMIELLASDASRHITGSVIAIDGGWSAW